MPVRPLNIRVKRLCEKKPRSTAMPASESWLTHLAHERAEQTGQGAGHPGLEAGIPPQERRQDALTCGRSVAA